MARGRTPNASAYEVRRLMPRTQVAAAGSASLSELHPAVLHLVQTGSREGRVSPRFPRGADGVAPEPPVAPMPRVPRVLAVTPLCRRSASRSRARPPGVGATRSLV